MTTALDDILRLYWQQSEYMTSWRLCFDSERDRRVFLTHVLQYLPEEWGRIEFFHAPPDQRFIVLFTHNYDNAEARKNEERVLSVLTNSSIITFFGAEGASGEIDVERFRMFPHQDSIRVVAEYMFRESKISPLIHVHLTSVHPLHVWGIEDPELYEEAHNKLLTIDPDYWSTVDRRVPVLFENLLLRMSELNISIAGITLSEYNFAAGHRLLLEQGIAHAGVRAASAGQTQFGATFQRMLNQKHHPSPLERLFQEDTEKERERKASEYAEWRKGKRNSLR